MNFFDEEIENLEEKIIQANNKYRSGEPIMTDDAYDSYLELLKSKISNSSYNEFIETLNEGLIETEKNTKQDYIIGSLIKLKYEEPEEFYKFINKQNIKKLFVSEKVDGVSAVCSYENGKLLSILSRGDGSDGTNWTNKKDYINIPKIIPYKGKLDIRGELSITNEDYLLLGHKNRRNSTAGIMNSKSIEPEKLKYIYSYFYEVLSHDVTIEEQFQMLKNNGFEYPKTISITTESDILEKLKEFYFSCKATSEYDIDGLVISDVDNKREDIYYPTKKVAFKILSIPVETVVTGITWELSKGRLLKPVVNIKPVDIDGSTISNVTGNNARFISENGIDKGAIITIVKAGSVIPKIIEVVKLALEVGVPLFCPECSGHLSWKGDADIHCANISCGETKRVEHFIKAIGIERVSESSLRNWNILTFNDLLKWAPDTKYKTQNDFWFELEEKVFHNDQISILRALPMDGMGTTLFDNLLTHVVDLSGMRNVFVGDIDSLPAGIGIKTIENAKQDFGINYNILKDIISDDRYKEPETKEIVEKDSENKLEGISFLITGTLSKKRNEFENIISENGGINASSVNKNLKYLLCGTDQIGSSTKWQKANKLGVTIISEDEFYALLK